MTELHILQLVDSLAAGGTEQVAVQLSNHLAREGVRVTLGTTRAEGPLAPRVERGVGRLRLERRGRFDLGAIRRLRRWLIREKVDVVHAHSSSLFLAVVATIGTPIAVVWHDHFGRWQTETRSTRIYGPAIRRAKAVVAVHPALVEWAVGEIGVDPAAAHYLPNFVALADLGEAAELPGKAGERVVCVANFRAQKDHILLLRAWEDVAGERPETHLFLIGGKGEEGIRERVARRAATLPRIDLLGERADVPALLAAADVGVLSSRSEGMPISLLEYGAAGLGVVATDVGSCGEVLDGGRAGLLVPSGDAEALAAALVLLLRDGERRRELGRRLRARVAEHYSARSAVARLRALYDDVKPPERLRAGV